MNKPIAARPVFPNQSVRARYRKRLNILIDEMHASVKYWTTAAYRKYPPRMAVMVEQAQDAAPSIEIQAVLNDLAKRWIDRFNDMSNTIAEQFVNDMQEASTNSFAQSLKDAGWTVEFKITPTMRDAMQASIGENVGLIRSIPEQYLRKVEGAVMRSYSAGRDLQAMVKDIQAIYPSIGKRAKFIALDQSNKLNAVVNRTRQLDLGITEAIWLHSHAGKEPRPDHLAANGKTYNIADGYPMNDGNVLPGELPHCRCTCRPVIPFKKS